MILPHDTAFRYRQQILAAVLAAAFAVAFVDPGSDRTDALSDAFSICVVSVLGYVATRALVWVAAKRLRAKWPILERVCALVCFYGAVPLLLAGLYFGSWAMHAPTPSPATVAFVMAVAVSIAAGAFAAIHATAGRDQRLERP